jgi:hypothetical protein
MSNLTIFIVGIAITLITGMGILTSQVFLGYNKFKLPNTKTLHQNEFV